MAKIAIMGFGTVGSGVYEIMRKNASGISRKASADIDIKYILDIRDFSSHPENQLFTKSFDDILNDSEVEVVVEVMGGLHPAYEFTKAALEAGKSVVTSNKELVATYGSELLKIAEDNNINYMFEASVGGGIPIIRPLHQCLAANEINQIIGILNGTTNYILTQMIRAGKSFEEALADAQAKGYAERNPAADVEGHDACRKIAILSSLASGKHVDYNEILTEGITGITLEDVHYADSLGYVIKLIGFSDIQADGRVFARVCPMLVQKSSPLAGVEDVFNAIMVKGDSIGEVMFYGRGAGKLPTASAVVADVIDCVKHINKSKHIMWTKTAENFMISADDVYVSYFVRATTDKAFVKNQIPEAEFVSCDGNETVFVTPRDKEGSLNGKLAKIGGVLSKIRILEE
ncbi:MAG: homoserine dehydrogenase [Clostridia bacterium]|nr:homoserine dehydrogenase [Clostridia bacterium]